MTRKQHFADNFWDIDIKSSAGFDVLAKKLKDGRQMCKDFEDFLKQRARIEDVYARDLLKLAHSAGGSTETGSLRTSWDVMKCHLAKVGQEHGELSQAINKAISRVGDFKEAQKKDFKKEESSVRGCITRKLDQVKKTHESKKSFEKMSADAEQLKLQLKAVSDSGQTRGAPADMSKLYNKQIKTEEEALKLNDYYKDNLTKLNQIQKQWESQMTNACNVFEKLEEQRILFLRNEMWAHLNVLSQTYVRNDNNNEEVRLSLEKCDPDADIINFITTKRTGTTRPALVPYDANNRQLARQNRPGPRYHPGGRHPQPHPPPFSGPSVVTFKK